METLIKDTHELVDFLQTKGYSKEQAEGFVSAVKDFNIGLLATSEQQKILTTKINYLIALNSAIFAGLIVLLLGNLIP